MENNSAEWDKTSKGEERLMLKEPLNKNEYKTFKGRHIIGRDRPINGGVYLGSSEREAIVVDDSKQLELINIYRELVIRQKLKEMQGGSFKADVLSEVDTLTKEIFPSGGKAIVTEIISEYPPDTKISLATFIKKKGGVCRHKALLAGYLLEKLKNEGYISGEVSIDRNYIPEKAGHAWVRYINSEGEIYIIDPSKNFVGLSKDADENRWLYERPKEINK